MVINYTGITTYVQSLTLDSISFISHFFPVEWYIYNDMFNLIDFIKKLKTIDVFCILSYVFLLYYIFAY